MTARMLKAPNLACLFFAGLLPCAQACGEISRVTETETEAPAPMLAKHYQEDIPVLEYLVSEKLDGVRARWTGTDLISRNGNTFTAPPWFTENFPNTVLEGELWSERGKFQTIASITARTSIESAEESGWQTLRLMVFDLPRHSGRFAERVVAMQSIVNNVNSPYLATIPQYRVLTHQALAEMLDLVNQHGGEGLMLHHQDALYKSGRSNTLLKLKKLDDAEGVVIGYKAGKGKYRYKLGALELQMPNGKIFYVGTGFTDAQRSSPPPIGSLITYQYQGLTDSGLPRFPVFLRVRTKP